eukprot:COSAG06_NODE_10840_length_1608_cov_2.890451_2_plen_142_part_00
MKNKNLQSSPAYLEAYSLLTFQTALANVTSIDTSRPTSGSSPSDGAENMKRPFSRHFHIQLRSFCQDRLGADIRKRREKEALSAGNETAARPFSWDHQSEFYGDVHCYLYDVDNWYEKHAVSAMPFSYDNRSFVKTGSGQT